MAQTLGSVLAALVGKLVYGIKSDLMLTKPVQSCVSAFWVELIATFIVLFLAASMIHHAQAVRNSPPLFTLICAFNLIPSIC